MTRLASVRLAGLERQTVCSRRLSADFRRIASSLLLQILQYLSSSLLALLVVPRLARKYSVRKPFVALVVGFACLAGCGGEQGTGVTNAGDVQRSGAPGTGATASDFSARDIDGKTVRLSTYLGKQAILLNFWQTWCEPCVAEFPHLRRMYEANKDKGFVVFGVAMDGPETVANVPAFAKRNQLNFPVLLDEDSHVAAIYNPKKSAPLSVLIDKTGKISVIREGYNPGDEEYLAREVAKVLDGAGAPK